MSGNIYKRKVVNNVIQHIRVGMIFIIMKYDFLA
jgi:hypothetical protein